MKRHESIVALSRDHHFGLLFCWKIRAGIKKQIAKERMSLYVHYFWNHHLKKHFEEEETLLFVETQDSLCMKAMNEHKDIRAIIETIRNKGGVPELNALTDLLDKHIRFEERELFPHLEKALSLEALSAIGLTLQQLQPSKEKDNYTDEFWI